MCELKHEAESEAETAARLQHDTVTPMVIATTKSHGKEIAPSAREGSLDSTHLPSLH